MQASCPPLLTRYEFYKEPVACKAYELLCLTRYRGGSSSAGYDVDALLDARFRLAQKRFVRGRNDLPREFFKRVGIEPDFVLRAGMLAQLDKVHQRL